MNANSFKLSRDLLNELFYYGTDSHPSFSPVMLQENETSRVVLDLSNEHKQLLIKRFPDGIIPVASVEIDGEINQPVRLKLSTSDQSKQNESMVARQISFNIPATVVSGASPGRNNFEEQNREANYDVDKPTVQSPEQHKPLMSSAKSGNPPPSTSNQSPDSTSGITMSPQQQQQPGSGPLNVEASCLSKVTTDSGHSGHSQAQQKSSGDLLVERAVSEQGVVPEEQSTLVTLDQYPRFEVEQARKKEHTVHCVLHRSELKCNLCETPEICQSFYDKEFASQFEQFLDRDLNTSLASANNEDIPNDNFLDHIVTHFHADNCPSVCSRLWKYCLNNKLFWVIFKYAPKGFLVYSDSRQNAVGTVVKTYFNYRNVNMIGAGGFGNVYKYSDQMAVKEEFKQPLIAGYRSPELFQRIMELDHPHVIKVLEYIAGSYDKDGNKCFLSVMYYKNQNDLQKQFTKKLTCVLDYMKEYRHQEKFIFRNYTVLCRHVFKGLCYLKSKGIIHRDIKPSNILVHQNCTCQSPLQCMCAGDGCVTYLLGDMDLLSLEEEGANLTYTYEEWKKMAGHDPAGTIGMKPPESFFRTEKGERMTTHKSDVWSAGVAMMNVLIGKTIDSDIQEKFSKFIEVATEGTKAATKSITESSKLLNSIMDMFDAVFKQMKKEPSNSGLVNNEMNELGVNLRSLKKMLDSGEESLSRSQSFQGGFSDVYKEENPLARMLTTAHMARTLHWRCILILPHIYNTQLWAVMHKTLDAIGAGIKLVPDQREDATTIVDLLKATPPVDFSNSEIEN